MADAAMWLLDQDVASTTGECHIDADVLRRAGVTDLSAYASVEGTQESDLELDLFVDTF